MASKIAIGLAIMLAASAACIWTIRVRSSAKTHCIAFLKQLEGAKATWTLEHKKRKTDVPTWHDLIGKDKYIRDMPQCPYGGSYTLHSIAEKPTCSCGHRL